MTPAIIRNGSLMSEPRLDPPDPDDEERKQLRERLRLERAEESELWQSEC